MTSILALPRLQVVLKASPLDLVKIKEIGSVARVVQVRIVAGTIWYNADYFIEGRQTNVDLHSDDFEVVKS